MTDHPIERAKKAILAKVPLGYGMTESEADEYARAAIREYLRAEADIIAHDLGDVWNASSRLLFRLAAELEQTP